MSTASAHDRWWQISEIVFGIPFLLAVGLQLAWPLSFPAGWPQPVMLAAGLALLIAGVALVVLARGEFARHSQPTDPGRPTTGLVTSGVFSISRNPLYLGIATFLAGAALAFDLPWVLALLVPALLACQLILIEPEERYLAARFNAEYGAYAARVQRWFGRRGPSGPGQ